VSDHLGSSGGGFPMSEEQFRLIRDAIYEYCGILFGDELRAIVRRRLEPRLRARALSDFTAYHRYLRFGAEARAELEEAVELLTTNETYFFREEYQLRAFSEEIVPALVKHFGPRGRRLSVWSAGCATGEECYTIAILTQEHPLLRDWDVHIFGCDISRRVLAAARRGIYRPGAFRVTPPRHKAQYFTPLPDGTHEVRPDLRERVTFGHMNLLDDDRVALVGEVDVIFCRNVMIYFDLAARKRLIHTFHGKLVAGGYLLLGHAESLLSLTTEFELCHLRNDLVYRKPLTADGAKG
jgi:chemotaxis protein methyltransferase CheR